jgi:16S rRNA (guanine527-N7)-methyltransferase
MPTLSMERLADLVDPFYPSPQELLLSQLSTYLDLLVKWNAHTNLTAIRDPDEIVRRHFGESLFAARHLPPAGTLLDLGSGAGFPGLPIQLAVPELKVTLSESQNKKASFLREVVRTLDLGTEVWGHRVEDLPASRRFDVVTLRAVDNPTLALELARRRLAAGGQILHLAAGSPPEGATASIPMPGSETAALHFLR